MDNKTSNSLNPQFKATYDKIMGINTSQQTPEPNQNLPTLEHVPQVMSTSEIQYQSGEVHKPHISALDNTHIPEIRGDSIGVYAPQNKNQSNHILLKILFVIGIILFGGYILLWLKFFSIPLPF